MATSRPRVMASWPYGGLSKKSNAAAPVSEPITDARRPPTSDTAATVRTKSNATSVFGRAARRGIQAAATATGSSPSTTTTTQDGRTRSSSIR